MADTKSAPVVNSIRLLPIRGKYYETSLPKYGPQRIWKVLPGNEDKGIWGTPVPPYVAFELLMIRPDVVKLAPPSPGEDYSKLFTAEQIEDLESKALYGVPKARLSGAAAAAPAESAAIARDVQALNKSIEAQKAENKELRDQLNKVTETLAALVTAQNTAKAKAAPPPPPKPSATSAAE